MLAALTLPGPSTHLSAHRAAEYASSMQVHQLQEDLEAANIAKAQLAREVSTSSTVQH
jgi:hypothetical protein